MIKLADNRGLAALILGTTVTVASAQSGPVGTAGKNNIAKFCVGQPEIDPRLGVEATDAITRRLCRGERRNVSNS